MNITDRTLVFRLGENNSFDDLNITTEIKHFIADLRGVTPSVAETVKEKFITFGDSISKMKGSFLIRFSTDVANFWFMMFDSNLNEFIKTIIKVSVINFC